MKTVKLQVGRKIIELKFNSCGSVLKNCVKDKLPNLLLVERHPVSSY